MTYYYCDEYLIFGFGSTDQFPSMRPKIILPRHKTAPPIEFPVIYSMGMVILADMFAMLEWYPFKKTAGLVAGIYQLIRHNPELQAYAGTLKKYVLADELLAMLRCDDMQNDVECTIAFNHPLPKALKAIDACVRRLKHDSKASKYHDAIVRIKECVDVFDQLQEFVDHALQMPPRNKRKVFV